MFNDSTLRLYVSSVFGDRCKLRFGAVQLDDQEGGRQLGSARYNGLGTRLFLKVSKSIISVVVGLWAIHLRLLEIAIGFIFHDEASSNIPQCNEHSTPCGARTRDLWLIRPSL